MGVQYEIFLGMASEFSVSKGHLTVHLGLNSLSSLNHEMNQCLTKRKLMSPRILH